MKEVLITGGAGFVGSNLAKLLVEKGFHVTILDDFFTGDYNHLKGLNVDVVEGCVTDESLVRKLVKQKEIVFHLAARNIIASIKHPKDDLNTNIIGTFNVLNECKNAHVQRVVYTSTSSIYGNPKYIPISEDDTPNFLNFYSISKYAGEGYAKTFYEQYNLPVSIVRYSNIYGTNQSPSNPYSGVIGKFIFAALNDEPICIHGDGEQTRDFTYIDDACNATLMVALDLKGIGDVFNIGTGTETTINSLAELIIRLTNSKSKVEHIDKRDIDNIRRRVMNIEKIRYKIKVSPLFNLRAGLSKTIEWSRKHQDRFVEK